MTSDDMALVREYAQSNSERVFATLVSRHVNLVYSVALRQAGDPHLAAEITQSVFITLARKAKSLSPKTILPGWLCRTARYISADTLKIQRRRQFREQEAHMQAILNEPDSNAWKQIAPLLDEALNCLGETEHDAVVLRFLDGKELRNVGAAMGTTEDAARMRVNRGLEKLREFFTKRGVTLSAATIAGAVAANSVHAAPAGLAAAITAAALSGATVTTAAVTAATKTIAMTTLQKTIVTATVVVLTGAGIYEARQAAQLREQIRVLGEQPSQIPPGRADSAKDLEVSSSLQTELEAAKANERELLRLRGEVTRLRKEAAELASDAREANDFRAEMLQVMSNTPPVRTLASTTVTTAPWNQAVLTGGWKTPSGKRVIVVTTPSTDGTPGQLTIKSQIVEYTDQAGIALGLDQFNTDDQVSTKASRLSAQRLKTILKAAENHEGVDLISAPAVTTLSGRQTQVQVVAMHQTPSGENYSTGPVLDLIPTIEADGQSVQMVISAHLNYLIPTPRH